MRRLLDGRSRLDFPPPMWKVRRELFRVGRQIDDLVARRTGFSLTQAYLRHYVDPRVRRLAGALTLHKRAAIYMIFPSGGVLASHHAALDYMLQSGYVPVVVSNLPLSPADQASIRAKSAALIIRPNFGYDFAAYRDGLRYLDSLDADLDYLAIFNDSTWFPVRPDRDWFAEAEAKDCDYVGSVFHCAMDPDVERDFRSEPWQTDVQYPSFHYGSYSLLIRGALLKSAGFKQFWRDYAASNDKAKTITGGEIGLSQMVIGGGFSHAATLDNAHLDALLTALPPDRLRDLAAAVMTPMYPKLRQQRLAVLATDPPVAADLRNFILKSVVKQGPAYALTDFDVRDRSGNFIKKSSLALDRTSGDQTLHLLQSLPGPTAPVFLAEARAIYAKKHGA